jgi:tetratricopeptide (TPR) repeat protein
MAADSTNAATDPAPRSSGVAGRTNYDAWHKKTKELLSDVDKEEQVEKEASEVALGLDGKYASSQAEVEERQKAKDIKKAKKALENYQKRESAIKAGLAGLLGPVVVPDNSNSNSNSNNKDALQQEEKQQGEPQIVRVTRDMLDAGKRVVKVEDTSGASQSDTIVLTADLSLLESKMKANAMAPVKSFPEDAENEVEEEEEETPDQRSVFGVIKAFISNVHNCTILIKCKIISGSIELSHCSNVIIRVEKDATVATIQADLCQDISIEFRDAPSGKNSPLPGQKKIYWGEDKEDRIFHAGVKNMLVKTIRDGYTEQERLCDYTADGAKALGKATPEEFQFVTSVLGEELVTEAVMRAGATTGENARAMTQREMEESKEKREKAAAMALNMAEDMIKFKETDKGKAKVTKKDGEGEDPVETVPDVQEPEEEEIEEVFGSMSKDDIDAIVKECEKNKARGNEAFGAGEYAQAILLYSLALDKAEELPDSDVVDYTKSKPLFPRDVTLSNRAACFLKMGNHEKAEADAVKAATLHPANVKAHFRHGLALHAMKNYQEAIPVLAKAHKLEPKNKQIKEALQFAEVRMTQEMRKRMEG